MFEDPVSAARFRDQVGFGVRLARACHQHEIICQDARHRNGIVAFYGLLIMGVQRSNEFCVVSNRSGRPTHRRRQKCAECECAGKKYWKRSSRELIASGFDRLGNNAVHCGRYGEKVCAHLLSPFFCSQWLKITVLVLIQSDLITWAKLRYCTDSARSL